MASSAPDHLRTPGLISNRPCYEGINYSFDEHGEVVGLANVVVQVLPTAERITENHGYKVLGAAPIE